MIIIFSSLFNLMKTQVENCKHALLLLEGFALDHYSVPPISPEQTRRTWQKFVQLVRLRL